MAGDLRAKERALITLTTTGASLTTGSAGVANGTADFDARSTGNVPDDLQAQFELTCQWASVAGIAAGAVVAEIYLLPILDGTNAPDIDLTPGSSRIPYAALAAILEATKTPTAATNARFISGNVPFNPVLMRPYLVNRAVTTMSSGWSLKVISVQGQYT